MATSGPLVEELLELLVAHRHHLRLGDGGGGRGARARVEERELAEHLAGAEDGEEVLAAVAARAAELDLALADDVEPVALVALVEQDVAALQARGTSSAR